ncbi:hypothetical protein DFQ14_103293 [Halopolyspora algeriensis]|uniref:PPE family protein n=1 Tax=Halopolyspora algeriensis TaxID=1500506 RepID=A0A368VTI4_9ACTN|nr:hypothetical protein [Halopolyspora algeriensis]RCW45322.1 hypothetical protein DFQ14_103293 [Halopolyspora algeriensis]TQM47362.1 hypothetical protein FHU43_3347 [Halopolyspora algeriensis]
MTSGEPEYRSHEYIADRERQAYVDAGGVEAHRMAVSGTAAMDHAVGRAQRAEAKREAAQVAAEYGHQQAATLSGNHRLHEKPADLGATHYLSYPHRELSRFVRENFDPVAVHDMGRYYHKVGNDLIEFSGRIRKAAAKTEESWQGAAGDAMRSKMAQVADHMGHSGEAAQLTANQLGMQAEAAERARNAMPEEIEVDTAAALKENAQNPDPTSSPQQANALAEKQERARAAHEEAARVVSTMESDFGTAAASTPKFAPPPPPPGDDGGSGPTSGSTAPVGGFTSPGGSGGAAPTYSASTAPSGAAPPAAGGSTPPLAPSGSGAQAPAGTSPSWASPGSSLPPGAVRGPDGTIYRQDPRTGQWMRQNPHNGRWAPVPPGQQVPGGGRAGSGASGGGTARPGGGFGPRGSGGSVPGSTMTPGGRAGSALTGSPASPTSAAGAAPSSSQARGGRMPMGAMGGQNQQGGDEEQHERKYLLEADEIGGDLGLPRVAPPVLGALPDEDGGH